jgi:hypothetical protein
MKTVILLWFLGAASVVLAGVSLLNDSWWIWKWLALLIVPGLILRHWLRQRRAAKAIIPAIRTIEQGTAKAIIDQVKRDTGVTLGIRIWTELQRLEMTGEIEAKWRGRNAFGEPRQRVYQITPPRKSEVIFATDRGIFGKRRHP